MNLPDYIIKCRDIRRFIIQKCGATTKEINEAFPNAKGCLNRMRISRSVRCSRMQNGGEFWEVVPLAEIAHRDVSADLSFEKDE